MKPISNHWADIAAMRLVNSRPENSLFTVASGITPSGKVHVGNFREVITVDLVAKALKSLGKNVRFIYSWDNFDTFRKVPKNVPDPKAFEAYLRQPIARIPDPWQQADNYALGRMQLFEAELKEVGIEPEYRYQESLYGQSTYAEEIKKVFENLDSIKEILNKHRTSPLADDWLPTSVYCSKCHKDEMQWQKYEGDYNYSYQCASCEHEETFDIRKSSNLKLIWRVDWPMRWHYEKVDFEPGGKDHSSQGGSYDTGKEIIAALWDEQAPMYLQYDFVMIKGGTGKMSSSSGQLYTLSEVLEVYEPQIIRWIFSGHRPNHDFSLAFDEDVIKIFDEFDRSEALAYAPAPAKAQKWQQNKRIYELSLLGDEMPAVQPVRAGFRVLCNRLQICDLDPQRTFTRFYSQEMSSNEDKERFMQRAQRAICWLKKHAPAEFCYTINQEPVSMQLSSEQEKALQFFRAMLKESDLEDLDPKEVNELIWQKVIHQVELESKDVFKLIYNRLISRDQGPRLPSFLKEIGNEKLAKLI